MGGRTTPLRGLGRELQERQKKMGKAKMKTNRAAAKRFKLTGTGRIKRNKAYHGHLFTAKSPKRLRNLRKSSLVATSDQARAKKMLAGG